MNISLSKLDEKDSNLSDLLALLPFFNRAGNSITPTESRLRYLHEDITKLAVALDVPAGLRSYFLELDERLTAIHAQLATLNVSSLSRVQEYFEEVMPPKFSPLSPDEVTKLLHINSRLVELETAIYTRLSNMHSQLIGQKMPVATGLQLDDFDPVEIEFYLVFNVDPMRPSYRPDGDTVESITVMRQVSLVPRINELGDFDLTNADYWGIGDGKCHNDIPLASGHLLAGKPLCSLFHELFDHWDIGLKGMLQLEEIRFDIALRQSGLFAL